MKKIINIVACIALIFGAISCEEDPTNPALKDSDLNVYFWGEGDNIRGLAWEGFNVLIGDTLDMKLMVTPKNDTRVKWELEDGTILSETLEYSYKPVAEGTQKTHFIATRPSGYADTIVFNFRGVLEGYSSGINQWQSIEIPQGAQTGTFSMAFDMVPSKDVLDAVVGVQNGVASGYSNLSAIVRLNSAGTIDAYNDAVYASENILEYHAGVTYHVRMELDAMNMLYDVYVTPQGEEEVMIAKDYVFRNKVTHLNYWSLFAGDWMLSDPGTHRVFNMNITTHTLNEAPVFMPLDDIEINEGVEGRYEIEAVDPLGGVLVLEAENLPRFATFTDLGNGKGVLLLKPYANCGGCDLGMYDISIVAYNKVTSTTMDWNIEVLDPNAAFEVFIDSNDATVWGNGAIDAVYTNLFGGRVGTGVGGEDEVVGVMPVALPEIPEGKKIRAVYLKVTTETNNAWIAVDYDVYAIGARALPDVLPADFYIGDYGLDSNATAIQQGFIKNGAGVGEVIMNDASAKTLAAFMNEEYENGAKAGDFVFLRINANRAMPLWAHLQFKSANTDKPGTAPVLTVSLEDI